MYRERDCVLAYSGGLDTSAIIPWLNERGYRVHALLVDVGQAEDLPEARERALALGAAGAYVRDARPAMAREVLPLSIALGAVYEGAYRLGTALARPFIAQEQVRLARELGATVLAHGATGKGNDQIRFEFAYRSLAPDCEVVAPWKLWSMRGREDLVGYLHRKQCPFKFEAVKELSLDENLWHLSVEGGALEDPEKTLHIETYLNAVASRFLAARPEGLAPGPVVDVEFEAGIPVALGGRRLDLLEVVEYLNAAYRRAGWAWDLVLENRFTGVKSRGLYINPAAKLLHLAVDGLARSVFNKRAYDQYAALGRAWAEVLYRGEFFSSQRRVVKAAAEEAVSALTGSVRVHLDPVPHVARVRSPNALFQETMATFEASEFDHADAAGFIQLSWLSSIGRPEPLTEASHGDAVAAVPAVGSPVS